jgi:CheY-like chemotaxis protein
VPLGDDPTAAQSYHPDVLFLDVVLRVQSGYEVARDLLQNHGASAIVDEAEPNPTVVFAWPDGA